MGSPQPFHGFTWGAALAPRAGWEVKKTNRRRVHGCRRDAQPPAHVPGVAFLVAGVVVVIALGAGEGSSSSVEGSFTSLFTIKHEHSSSTPWKIFYNLSFLDFFVIFSLTRQKKYSKENTFVWRTRRMQFDSLNGSSCARVLEKNAKQRI